LERRFWERRRVWRKRRKLKNFILFNQEEETKGRGPLGKPEKEARNRKVKEGGSLKG